MPFHPFTTQHYLALVVGIIVGAAFLTAGKRGGRGRRLSTQLLAFLNLTVYPLSLAAWWSMPGRSYDNMLPFQLCDIAAFTAGFALLTQRPLLCTLTYFWGLAATVQALITPALTVGFPSGAYFMFFVHHFVVVIAALYLPVVMGWRPKSPFWRSPLEVYVYSVIYLLCVMIVNKLLGSNFAFASRPPDNPSLIDKLGPWPWYLFSIQAIGLALFMLLALPFKSSSKQPSNEPSP